MRFFAGSPSIPDLLLDRRDEGRVVFLCGAGVSVNAGMPGFIDLTRHVVETLDPPDDSPITKAFAPHLEDGDSPKVPLDQIYNLLQQQYDREKVDQLVAGRLEKPARMTVPSREHDIIRRISSDIHGKPQIVTTNFDRLFETDSEDACHVPPALPNLSLGMPITGISYLHGRLPEASTHHRYPFVLGSADFGRAYLAEGWATRFVRELLAEYTVVLVGYQAEDPPINYLLQGLNHDGQSDRTKLFAFDKGCPETIEAKWKSLGVTPIAYPKHAVLWKTLEAWAERADDSQGWRDDVIAKTASDPKTLEPFERGQVAHLLRTTAGAQSFVSADPKPHPEWICVLDANSRMAEPSSAYGDGDTFDPLEHYGLDDDPPRPRPKESGLQTGGGHKDFKNFLEWNRNDDNPTWAHRLTGMPAEGSEPVPRRLLQFIHWIGESLDSPVMAWWAARQKGLHPRLLHAIRLRLGSDADLHPKARTVWNLIVERQSDSRQRSLSESRDWHRLEGRVAKEGWTAAVLREFTAVTKPMIKYSPSIVSSKSKPPQSTWEEVECREIADFEVTFPERHGVPIDVPDEMLFSVVNILQQGFLEASGLLDETGNTYVGKMTCYPDRDVDGDQYEDFHQNVYWFIKLFERLAAYAPRKASALSRTWPASDRVFFGKFRLYAANKPELFTAEEAYRLVEELDVESFWHDDYRRELLFLIADRWNDFSPEQKEAISKRILEGTEHLKRPEHMSAEQFKTYMAHGVLERGRWLQKQGCDWPVGQAEQLDQIAQSIPGWSDESAEKATILPGIKVGTVVRNEDPADIIDLPISEIIDKAVMLSKDGFDNLLAPRRPFVGLVKTDPRRALAALTARSRIGQYKDTEPFWSSLIENWPDDASDRLTRLMLHRTTKLSDEFLQELQDDIGYLLKHRLPEYLELDRDLAWKIFDIFETALISGISDYEAQIGEENTNRSRQTYFESQNTPVGQLTEGIVKSLFASKPAEGTTIPVEYKSRLERLMDIPGEGGGHAVAVLTRDISRLSLIDPDWVSSRLIPLLAFEHKASGPAWNGLLSGDIPNSKIRAEIKPLLLDLFPGIYDFGWNPEPANTAACWLMWMAMLHRDEADGLTSGEARNTLRKMSDETRQHVISWLRYVVRDKKNDGSKLVAPFINEIWPKEKRFKTDSSVRSWIDLLEYAGEAFADVFQAVKPHLAPVEGDVFWLYHFTHGIGHDHVVRSPAEVLDMLDRIVPNSAEAPPYDLKQILDLIKDADDSLMQDPRFSRLSALSEKA